MRVFKFLVRPLFHFITLFLTNRIISLIPIRVIRNIWLVYVLRMKKGKKTYIDMGCYYMQPWNLKIGSYCHINQGCLLDSRGG